MTNYTIQLLLFISSLLFFSCQKDTDTTETITPTSICEEEEDFFEIKCDALDIDLIANLDAAANLGSDTRKTIQGRFEEDNKLTVLSFQYSDNVDSVFAMGTHNIIIGSVYMNSGGGEHFNVDDMGQITIEAFDEENKCIKGSYMMQVQTTDNIRYDYYGSFKVPANF